MSLDLDNIASIALNERGAKTAINLGLTVEIGKPNEFVELNWRPGKIIICIMALPIVVRILAKKNLSKNSDPIVICIDETGNFIIPVLGGHKGANTICKELAARGKGTAVVTTASDNSNLAAIDAVTGFYTTGNSAAVIESMLDGFRPLVQKDIDWPAPIQIPNGNGPAKVLVSDSLFEEKPGDLSVQLIPPSLVVGLGCSSDAKPEDVSTLIDDAFKTLGLDKRAIAAISTIDGRANHPAILSQNLPIESFNAEELAKVNVPNPSTEVESHVGTVSVAEASAMLSAKSKSLIMTKKKNARATIAIARKKPKGIIRLVGLGPGNAMMRSPQATKAIVSSEIVIGFDAYIKQCSTLLAPHQLVMRSPIGNEVDRANQALRYALEGRSTAIVCSGDPEIFAMASITFEVVDSYCQRNQISELSETIEIEVVPGITAGLAAGALLGAPLGHDHAYISLSDLLTPWETIERRLELFGEADITLVIYNPQSNSRTWQLPKAIEILSRYRRSDTPIAVVKNAARQDEIRWITTISQFSPDKIDMTSIIVVGSSTTKVLEGYLYTPRGYKV